MNTAPPMPSSAENLEKAPEQKVHYTPELYDFLDGLAESYAEEPEADRLKEARAGLDEAHPPAAALAEVYLFSSGWEKEMQALEKQSADAGSIEEAEDRFFKSRAIFMENCRLAYPYIPFFDRDIFDPSAEKAFQAVDKNIDDISKRLEESLAKGASVQLNIDVEQMYRLQVLKNELEIEISRGVAKPVPSNEEIPSPPTQAEIPPSPAAEKSLEQTKTEAVFNWHRLGLDKHLGISLDQWIAEGLRRADPHLFGDDFESMKKWRAFDTAIGDVRDWYWKQKPDQKVQSELELWEKIDSILGQF